MGERRMTASQRRSQLVDVAKAVFAEHGYDGTTVEEIAARASVSKPVVYEHFGGKEGIYAVIVDRESARLLEMITSRLGPDIGAREQIHASALAFLDYIEADPAGFRVLTRDSPARLGDSSMAGLLGDVADKAEEVLRGFFTRSGVDLEAAPPRLDQQAADRQPAAGVVGAEGCLLQRLDPGGGRGVALSCVLITMVVR